MIHSNLSLHQKKVITLFVVGNGLLLLHLLLGDAKYSAEIDWLDVLGEGGAVFLTAIWLFFLLKSRPAGHVTNSLFLGLTFIFMATWQDVLDEFLRLPEVYSNLENIVGSLPMPVGMCLLTWGLFQWHQEQLLVSAQLNKRERIFRDHRSFDYSTQVASADYLKAQLKSESKRADNLENSLSIMMLDIDSFDEINRRFGHEEGDRFLQHFVELIILNLRPSDLLCRYAGDRFVVLLPATGSHLLEVLAKQLQLAVRHFAFKTRKGETIYREVTVSKCVIGRELVDEVFNKLSAQVEQLKEEKQHIRNSTMVDTISLNPKDV